MDGNQVTLSVIIVTHNSLPLLVDCLNALDRALLSIPSQIIIVDNNSHDASVAAVKNRSDEYLIVENEKNRGFASACNQGAELAEGEYLLFLNPDVTLEGSAITKMLEVYAQESKVGLVVPRLRFPDDTFQANCRNFPQISNLLFSRGSFLSALFRKQRKNAFASYTLPDYDATTAVTAVAGTVLLITKELFTKMNGFDSRFFLYMEDTDLSYRVHLHGNENYFVPDAGAVHHWGSGSTTSTLVRKFHHHYSFWQYFLKHAPNGFSLLVLPFMLIGNLCVTALAADKRGR
ncbi:MAG: glycosyltransferase family 2 protein [candidate division Zixibacteria bacterium]|nr:glycosyltransferase family 2 protein [candidate division Zixibacteria bacterium]